MTINILVPMYMFFIEHFYDIQRNYYNLLMKVLFGGKQ